MELSSDYVLEENGHNIKLIYDEHQKTVEFSISLRNLNKDQLTVSEDGDYYILNIHTVFVLPANSSVPLTLEADFQIKKEDVDNFEAEFKEMMRKDFALADQHRDFFSPNFDGRITGAYYGGRF